MLKNNNNSNIIALKFGGSSVADTAAMANVISILGIDTRKKIVVLSACKGITDKLQKSAEFACEKKYLEYIEIAESIRAHHHNICLQAISSKSIQSDALRAVDYLCNDLTNILSGIELLEELTSAMRDKCFSFGELLSTTVFSFLAKDKGLNSCLALAEAFVVTDAEFNSAKPIEEAIEFKCQKELLPLFDEYDTIITQGFIGKTVDNRVTTLGRGGSDLSAALIGAAINADEIQIWTDVSGVLSADPRVISSAFSIPVMSFNEVRDLAFFGAKVLHPDTIKPAVKKQIPVKVLNTFQPRHPGTTILGDTESHVSAFDSVISNVNAWLIEIETPVDANSHELLSKVVTTLASNSIKILFSSSSESLVTLLIEAKDNFIESLLRSLLPTLEMTVKPCAAICVGGNNIGTASPMIYKFTGALHGFTIIKVFHGISLHSLLVLTTRDCEPIALNKIHDFIIYNRNV